MLVQVYIQSLCIGQDRVDLLIERRVLRERLTRGKTKSQDREICKPQGTQVAGGKHGGLLFDWIEYHPGSQAPKGWHSNHPSACRRFQRSRRFSSRESVVRF